VLPVRLGSLQRLVRFTVNRFGKLRIMRAPLPVFRAVLPRWSLLG
jgi:hypothetical protein